MLDGLLLSLFDVSYKNEAKRKEKYPSIKK